MICQGCTRRGNHGRVIAIGEAVNGLQQYYCRACRTTFYRKARTREEEEMALDAAEMATVVVGGAQCRL